MGLFAFSFVGVYVFVAIFFFTFLTATFMMLFWCTFRQCVRLGLLSGNDLREDFTRTNL